MDVVVVLKEEPIHELLHGIYISIVDGIPCFPDDFIHLKGVCGISFGCVGCGWTLYGLQ